MAEWLVGIIGFIGGVAVGLQTPITGAMGQRVGGIASSFIVHLGGALFSGALLLLRGGERIRAWTSLPWYMLSAGIFGLILYATISVTLPRLGATLMIVLIVAGQLSVGVLVDHFGLFGVAVRPVDLSRLLGIGVLALGVWLISK